MNEGIIAGKGSNTFAPSANVTGSEAAKMLLVALGYNTTYEKIGGANWQTATDVLANQAGLYDELGSMNTSDPLTRDNAAQMIYNTLNANKVKYELVPTVSANGQVTMTAQRVNVTKEVGGTTHNVTMLEDAFDAVKVEDRRGRQRVRRREPPPRRTAPPWTRARPSWSSPTATSSPPSRAAPTPSPPAAPTCWASPSPCM